MKNKILWLLLFGLECIYGFEVNTHQALTRCAITPECNQNGGTKNLDDFYSFPTSSLGMHIGATDEKNI
ncbi:hypothetical protein KKC13_09935 [bacterium]|nr:hypothetical protein [bacterium]MBU1956950.1 hypothetical protein [bacterium]